MYYKFVDIENIEEIKRDALMIFNSHTPGNSTIFYVNEIEFLKFNSLRYFIEDIRNNKNIDIKGLAFNLTHPNVTISTHTDTGDFLYSLNIPLTDSKNTYLSIFESTSPPELRTQISPPITFNYFDNNNCRLLEKIEVNRPCILNTQNPHNVSNMSDKIRIVLLIRLSSHSNQNIETFFKLV